MITTAARPLPTRSEVLADLTEANRQAKRQQCLVRVPNHDPSGWDQWHEWIDLLLADLNLATD